MFIVQAHAYVRVVCLLQFQLTLGDNSIRIHISPAGWGVYHVTDQLSTFEVTFLCQKSSSRSKLITC
jgi:hypothetical protein